MNSYYRQDIQGIRALAILLVVAAHVKTPYLTSGFIGVDIFFVISGYLITGLILRELSANQSISFISFYYRRIKRLLPALLFMLAIVCSATIIFLSPVEQLAQIVSAKKAVMWLSNFYFAFANHGYFDATSETFLLLHTWSLGVEEQFYLVWPLLLLLLAKSSSFDAKLIIRGVGYVFVLGFTLSIFLSMYQPTWAFYLMPPRAWQFAAGGLVYFYFSETKSKNIEMCGKQFSKVLIGTFGLVVIIISLFFVKKVSYPGIWALLPTLGACCMLMASVTEQEEKHVLSKVLTFPIIRWIGEISYSLYLWHWPVIVLGFTVLGETSFQIKLVLIAISLIMAVFSHYVVESPIRKGRFFSQKRTLGLTAAAVLSAAGIGLTYIWLSSVINWVKAPEQYMYIQAGRSASEIYKDGCDAWYQSTQVNPCIYGNPEATNSVVLLGDSIGAQWFPVLRTVFNDKKWKIVVITKSSCPIIDEPFYYGRIGRNYVKCEIWRNEAINWIVDNQPNYLFIGNAKNYFNQAQWIGGTERILEKVHDAASEIYFIQPTYSLSFNGPHCQSRFKWQENFMKPMKDCVSKPKTGRIDKFGNWLKIAASNYTNVEVLNMNLLICPKGICRAQKDEIVVFRDNQHITVEYATSLAEPFKKLIHLE